MLPMSRTETVERIIVSAQVPTEVHEELERLAREADRSLSAEIRRALVAHVERRTSNEIGDQA
jgi:predicted transcriptional regulator